MEVLKNYAEGLEIKSDKWQLVTGKEQDIFDMAKHYMLGVLKDDTTADGYIHSGHFVLVDKERKIRGYYNGTAEGVLGLRRLSYYNKRLPNAQLQGLTQQ